MHSQLLLRQSQTIINMSYSKINSASGMALLALLVSIVSTSCQAERVSYTGYSLYRSIPQTEHQLASLRQLMEDKLYSGVQFWTEPVGLNLTVDMMVSPEEEAKLREILSDNKIASKKIIYDVEEVMRRTSIVHPRIKAKYNRMLDNSTNKDFRQILDASVFFTRYSRYSTIESKLNELAKNPKIKMETVGKSFQGRNMYLIKVSSDYSANKPIIFVDAGHHAREWISHVTLLYMLESLVNARMPTKKGRYATDIDGPLSAPVNQVDDQKDTLMSKLDEFDFWFVPVVNPDGYEYTHTTDRNWRKTRSTQNGNLCIGADPNRNYPHHWGEAGTSSFSCSYIYPGSKAMSEPEVALMTKLLKENAQRIKMYLSLHSYSQLILAPYGYDRVKPDNYDELMRVAEAGISAIGSVRGTIYRAGTSSIILYPAAGGSDDLAHSLGIRQAFTIELPDTGDYGFLLPPSEIVPVGQETVKGMSAMIEAMAKL